MIFSGSEMKSGMSERASGGHKIELQLRLQSSLFAPTCSHTMFDDCNQFNAYLMVNISFFLLLLTSPSISCPQSLSCALRLHAGWNVCLFVYHHRSLKCVDSQHERDNVYLMSPLR